MNDTPAPSSLHALISIPPIEEPQSEVLLDDRELHIRVPGQPKRRLPASLVTGLMIFGAAAFICPGIFLVAIIILPVALIAIGMTYLISPQTFASPIGPQEMWIGNDRITLSTSPALPKIRDDSDDDADDRNAPVVEPTLDTFDIEDIADIELVVDAHPGVMGIVITDAGGDTHIFGGALLPPASPLTEDVGDPRELEWILEIIETRLRNGA